MIRLPLAPLAAAILAVGEAAYLLCLVAGALWPDVFGMRVAFPTLLPGFTWLDPADFVLVLAGVALYGLGAAVVVWGARDFVAGRTTRTAS
jgi:hypothetical protein